MRIRAVRVGAVSLALSGIALTLWKGSDPGEWAPITGEWSYPWADVLRTSAWIVVQTLVLYAVFTAPLARSANARAGLTLLCCTVFLAWELLRIGTDAPGWAYANGGFLLLAWIMSLLGLFATIFATPAPPPPANPS